MKETVRAPDLDSGRRAVIQDNLDEVYAKLGHIAVEADEGAQGTVDGVVSAGKAPFEDPIDVWPRPRELEASLGPRTRRATLDAPAGTLVTLDLRFPPATPEALPAPAEAPPVARPSFLPEAREPRDDRHAPRTWWSLPRALGVGLVAAALASAGVGLSFEAASQSAADDARRMRAGLGVVPERRPGAAPYETS